MAGSQLIRLWRIEYTTGFMIDCFRYRKPTRLADSWAAAENASYTITERGLFDKGILGTKNPVAEAENHMRSHSAVLG